MDIKLNELLNRLESPGYPGEALSASEFAELCQLVRDMEDAKEPNVQTDAITLSCGHNHSNLVITKHSSYCKECQRTVQADVQCICPNVSDSECYHNFDGVCTYQYTA